MSDQRQQFERAVELLEATQDAAKAMPGLEWREKVKTFLRSLEPPDPVKAAIANLDKHFFGGGTSMYAGTIVEHEAWSTLRARLTALPLDEKALEIDLIEWLIKKCWDDSGEDGTAIRDIRDFFQDRRSEHRRPPAAEER